MTQIVHIPPLLFESGDRLDRDEFLDLWERMPNLKFAELVDGVVYLPSPVSVAHGQTDVILHGWAFHYAGRASFIDVVANATWLMAESAPQPDMAIRLRPEYGGQSWTEDKLAAGAPEFVAEVSRSSRSYDLGPKLELYEREGVQEYLAVLTEERKLQWRVRQAGRFQLIEADTSGIYRSAAFPGLWLDETAFWRQDIPALLATLEKGLQSPEFAVFRESHSSAR